MEKILLWAHLLKNKKAQPGIWSPYHMQNTNCIKGYNFIKSILRNVYLWDNEFMQGLNNTI